MRTPRRTRKAKLKAEQKQIALGNDGADMLAKKGTEGAGAFVSLGELRKTRVQPGENTHICVYKYKNI